MALQSMYTSCDSNDKVQWLQFVVELRKRVCLSRKIWDESSTLAGLDSAILCHGTCIAGIVVTPASYAAYFLQQCRITGWRMVIDDEAWSVSCLLG